MKTTWLMSAFVAGALAMSETLAGSVAAAEPPTLYYSGDPAFCRSMLERAREVEYVEPVLPDPPKARHYFYADTKSSRVYFTDKTVPIRELSDAVFGGNWEKLFEGGFVPEDPKKAAGWVVMSDEWKALDRQCPGILQSGTVPNKKTGERAAPNDFALYRLDMDNEGVDDTVLFRVFTARRTVGRNFDFYDFDSCRAKEIFFSPNETRIIRFDGKAYIAVYHSWGISIRHVDSKARKVIRDGNWTCSFHGWQTDFDELTDYLTKPWSLKWRK